MNAPPSPHGVADWPRMIGSLLLATLVALAPWGQSPIIPDVLTLVLAWWALHRPQRGLLAAGFMLGVLMDTHTASTLGEHALLYTLIVWMTLQFQRRIAWFRLGGQMLHMLGVFLMAQAVLAGARFLLGLPFLGPEQFLPWLGTALLWPLADLLLPARHATRRKTNGAAAYGSRTAPFVDPERVAGEETDRGAAAPTGVPIYAHTDEPVAAPDSHTAPATPAPQAQSASPTWINPEELVMQGAASPQHQPQHAARRRPAYWHYAPDDHGH